MLRSPGAIPATAVKYTQLSTDSQWKQGCLKYQIPKSVRQKVLVLIILIVLSCLMMIYSCVSCERECSSYCQVLNKNVDHITDATATNTSIHVQSVHIGTLKQRLPQCIIIGVRKGGTRALLTYLTLHPDIAQAVKEPHFFDREENYEKGLEYYRSFMPFSYENQITLEKTPGYFPDTLTPERIYRMNSSIRLLLIVRDPVIRTISDYEQLNLKLPPYKRQSFKNLVLTKSGKINLSYNPVQTSLYYKYYPHWIEFFSPSQILVIDGDKFITNPYPHLYEIESFLGLGHKISEDKFYYNETKGFYCVEGLKSPCLGPTKGRPHSDVDPEVIEKLRNFFQSRNDYFFKMVNRAFDWQ